MGLGIGYSLTGWQDTGGCCNLQSSQHTLEVQLFIFFTDVDIGWHTHERGHTGWCTISSMILEIFATSIFAT